MTSASRRYMVCHCARVEGFCAVWTRTGTRYALTMAELDYAFLADFAQVEGGKLSAIGASYTHASVDSLDGQWITTIAGRVRTTIDAPSSELAIRIVVPELYELAYTDELKVDQNARPYGDGAVGILFAATVALPIIAGGLYEVFISIDGVECRRLAFDMSVGQ